MCWTITPDGAFAYIAHYSTNNRVVIRPVEKAILHESDVFPIGQLVNGRRSVDTKRTTAYKSTGMALYDLFVARSLYTAAKHQGVGREISL